MPVRIWFREMRLRLLGSIICGNRWLFFDSRQGFYKFLLIEPCFCFFLSCINIFELLFGIHDHLFVFLLVFRCIFYLFFFLNLLFCLFSFEDRFSIFHIIQHFLHHQYFLKYLLVSISRPADSPLKFLESPRLNILRSIHVRYKLFNYYVFELIAIDQNKSETMLPSPINYLKKQKQINGFDQ